MSDLICSYYEKVLSDLNIDDNLVCIESHGGEDLGGNLYYMAKEFLAGEHGKFIVAIVLKDSKLLPNNLRILLNRFGEKSIKILTKDTKEYVKILATAKYVLTDVQFSDYFRKREGQVCVQTWHGTPLKKLGYDFISDVAWTGAQKKSFIDSDIVLYPNKYTKKNMHISYRLDGLCSDNDVIDGYPRNAVFFDDELRNQVRITERITDKEVYAYMPTWRGSLGLVNQDSIQIELLNWIDEMLDDNKFLYVKFHRLMSDSINFSKYKRIRAFPVEWETYEFLTAVDCLITDYSSVMFDFLCTRRKIILFTYDKQDYLKKQGTYFNIDDLPFPQADSIESLFNQMNLSKDYQDESTFKYFCAYDNLYAAKILADKMTIIGQTKIKNEKDTTECRRLLLYGGNMEPNKHTTLFVDYVDSLIEKKYDVCVCYKNIDFIKDPIRLQIFQLPVDLISIDYYKNDILYDSNNCSNNSKLWEIAYSTQFHKIDFKKIVCLVDRYDEILELFAASPYSVTIVVDMERIGKDEYEKILELDKRKKVSIVNNLELLKL